VDQQADAADDRWQPFRDRMPLSEWVETARRMVEDAKRPFDGLFADYWARQEQAQSVQAVKLN